jgi:GDSL-like Lipase/Acylhydrolase family
MKRCHVFAVRKMLLVYACVVTLARVSAAQQPPDGTASRGNYVAMGSSYAAGPGIGTRAPGSVALCQQSSENYAHLFAQKRHLELKDVSCGGATTQSILRAWRGLPPQLDAVDADTTLVTITVGGNDVFFMSNLFAWSCENAPDRVRPAARLGICRAPASDADVETAFAGLEGNFQKIVAGVHERSPKAKIVFVNYLTLLPATGSCPGKLPLTEEEIEKIRAVAARLAAITRKAAQETGSTLVKASDLTKGHDVCSADPWVYGFEFPGSPTGFNPVPYHPKLQTMQAIADALDRTLPR